MTGVLAAEGEKVCVADGAGPLNKILDASRMLLLVRIAASQRNAPSLGTVLQARPY